MCIYHKIIEYFCLFVNVHMPGLIAGRLATAQQHEKAFCVSKLERLHAYFFARLIKRYYTIFLCFGAVCIRFLVHPGALIFPTYLIVAYRTQGTTKRDMFISLKYNQP